MIKISNLFNWFKKPKKQIPSIKPFDKNTVKFGWKRDKTDNRDYKYRISIPVELPPLIDLRRQCPPIYDQGELGSCTANALGAAYQFEEIKKGGDDFIPSRLFIYYNERKIEGTVNEDSGAAIRDGIKTMVREGVCSEKMWVYDISKFRTKPPCRCYRAALNNQVLEYFNLNKTLYDIKQCLAEGYPVVFGFMVFESFMSDVVVKTGVAPVPDLNEECSGGHAVMAVGYDDSKNALIVRNSWGVNWGLEGYFYMPYEYITIPEISSDFWTIRVVE